MKKARLNLIFIRFIRDSETWITSIFLNNKFIYNSEKKDPNFLFKVFKKLLKEKQKNHIFYSTNLTYFLLEFLRIQDKLEEKWTLSRYFIEKGSVYLIKLTMDNEKFIIIKNYEKFSSNWEIQSLTNDLLLNKNLLKNELTQIQDYLKEVNNCLHFLLPGWNHSSLSISSISLNIFKNHFNPWKILVSSSIKEDSIFRKMFYGPRCEVYGNSKDPDENIFHFDFKNAYGQIMLTEEFPDGSWELEINPEKITYPGMYYIIAESEKLWIPVLPIKIEENNELTVKSNNEEIKKTQCLKKSKFLRKGIIFPNGRIEGWYWYEEINLFLEKGGKVKKILKAYVFKRTLKPIFKDFAQYCINKRKENSFSKKFWKLIIASLYGRLGMKKQQTKTQILSEKEYIEKKNKLEIEKEIWIGQNVIIEIIDSSEPTTDTIPSNVLYAAIITSKARIKLFKALESVILNNGRPLYCDTDSVFAAYTKNVLDEKHGEIFWDSKKETTLITEAVFASSRTYSIKYNNKEETKIAGIPRNSVSFEKFYKGFYGYGSGVFLVNTNYYSNYTFEKITDQKIIDIDIYDKRHFSNFKLRTIPLYKINKIFTADPFFF